MASLDFEPRRRDFSPASLVARLVVLGAVALVLGVYIWRVWPAKVRPATRPTTAPARPARPIPASLPALSEVEQTVLAEVRDGEAVRERPLYFLLKRAAETLDRPGTDALPVEAEQLMQKPATFRGRLVRLRGVFLRDDYVEEPPQNLAGVREVRTGEMGSLGGTVVTFVLPRAAPLGGRVGDDVELTGYFLQVRRFTGSRDGKAHTGPLIMGVSLDHIGPPERVPVAWIVSLAVSVVLVIGLVAAAALLKERHRKRRRAGALRHLSAGESAAIAARERRRR